MFYFLIGNEPAYGPTVRVLTREQAEEFLNGEEAGTLLGDASFAELVADWPIGQYILVKGEFADVTRPRWEVA